MSINPEVIAQMKAELLSAPYGHKEEFKQRWALVLNLSPATISRLTSDGTRIRKGAPRRPELREWAKIVAQVKKRPPEEAGEISTDQAVRIAIEAKLIPVSAMDVHVSTFDRVMRELGTSKKSIRANRIQADRPNKAHHFDASTSAFFYIAGKTGADYVLRMHRPAKHYKNKPIPVDSLRPWYYGLIDDHSGRSITRCTAAQGESAADSLLFLSWAWSELGLPEELHADQGMLKKCLASSEFISRLGIALPEYTPYNKRGHGKIERPWRTTWQRFEKQFFAVDEWQKFEISLAEFNQRLLNFIEEQNERPHRFERQLSRMDAWRRVMLNGGIVTLPENALATVARRAKRKVDVDGTLEYGGQIFSVKGLHDAWVYVYEGVFDPSTKAESRLVVQDIVTRERFEVKYFKPLNIGEFKAHPDTEHVKAVKAGAELSIPETALPYRDRGQKTENREQKVVSLRIRTTEREVASVFDVEHYASIEDAWTEIHETVGVRMWTDEERRDVEKIITENKLEKEAVRSLALELREAIEVQKARAI